MYEVNLYKDVKFYNLVEHSGEYGEDVKDYIFQEEVKCKVYPMNNTNSNNSYGRTLINPIKVIVERHLFFNFNSLGVEGKKYSILSKSDYGNLIILLCEEV
ncbi:MAG: hypothetical protein ACRDBY_13950 [Cetobacterium sp.]